MSRPRRYVVRVTEGGTAGVTKAMLWRLIAHTAKQLGISEEWAWMHYIRPNLTKEPVSRGWLDPQPTRKEVH